MTDEVVSGAGRFPTTHWSVVAQAAGGDTDARSQALSDILDRYYPALYAHVLHRFRHVIRRDDVDDLVQGFIAQKVLERDLIGQADRARGRFRGFLCIALDRYIVSQFRQSAPPRAASSRAAGCGDGSPEGTPATESRRRFTPSALPSADDGQPAAPTISPGEAFDIAWARSLLDQVLRRMRLECQRDRPDLWTLFECRLLEPILHGTSPPSYERIVSDFGFASPMQAMNALTTAKRWFRRTLRSVIAEYAAHEADIDAEIADLQHILSRAGAR